MGRGRRLDDGQIVPLDVKTGDRVLFGKYTGSETKVDGTEYTIMREDDVLAILALNFSRTAKAVSLSPRRVKDIYGKADCI